MGDEVFTDIEEREEEETASSEWDTLNRLTENEYLSPTVRIPMSDDADEHILSRRLNNCRLTRQHVIGSDSQYESLSSSDALTSSPSNSIKTRTLNDAN